MFKKADIDNDDLIDYEEFILIFKSAKSAENQGMVIEIRCGWIVDSISFGGEKRGASKGGGLTKLNLLPGEKIVKVKADRVVFENMNCIGRLELRTSNGRVFGPFGSAPTSHCPVKGNIDLDVNSIHDIRFETTRDNRFIRDFQIIK